MRSGDSESEKEREKERLESGSCDCGLLRLGGKCCGLCATKGSAAFTLIESIALCK